MSEKINNSSESRKPMYLQVTEVQPFEKMAETTMETTQKLAKRINALFSSAFSDYHGAAVICTAGNGNVAPNQQFVVELHFRPVAAGSLPASDNRVRAFRPIEEGTGKTDLIANIKNIYSTYRSSAKFQMTEEAAEILSEFMAPGINIDPFKPGSYDQFKAEYQDTAMYGQAPIMVRITGIDLNRLIKKIYGGKNENGKRVDYGIIPYGPVVPTMNNPMVNAASSNWRVIIMRVDAEKTFDAASEFGLIPAANGGLGPVVTGTV